MAGSVNSDPGMLLPGSSECPLVQSLNGCSWPEAELGTKRLPGELSSALRLMTELGASQRLMAAFDPKRNLFI